MSIKDKIPFVGDSENTELEARAENAGVRSAQGTRYARGSVDDEELMDIQPGSRSIGVDRDTFRERLRAQPLKYYSALTILGLLSFGLFLGVIPFFPSLTSLSTWIPLLIGGTVMFIFVKGAYFQRRLHRKLTKLNIKESGNARVYHGEADILEEYIVFFPIVGWRRKGFRAAYYRIEEVFPSLVDKLGSDWQSRDRAGVRIPRAYAEITETEDFGRQIVARTSGYKIDPYSDEAPIEAKPPENLDESEYRSLVESHESLTNSVRRLEKEKETLEDQLREERARRRASEDEVIDREFDRIEGILDSVQPNQPVSPAVGYGNLQNRGDDDE